MKDGRVKPNDKCPPNSHKSTILVSDMARYLSGLAKLHRQDKTGNIDLSNGLQELSNALRPYSDYPISDLSDALKMKVVPVSAPKANSREADFPQGQAQVAVRLGIGVSRGSGEDTGQRRLH